MKARPPPARQSAEQLLSFRDHQVCDTVIVMRAARLALTLCLAGCGATEITEPTSPKVPAVEQAPEIDAMRHHIFNHLMLSPGMRVAEIGAGRGWFTFRIAEAIGPSGTVYPTDIDRDAIDALEQGVKRKTANAARVEPRFCRTPRDTALDDLPESSIDLVLIVDSVCIEDLTARMDERIAYLRSLRRILRPNGRLVYHPDCRCGGESLAKSSRLPFERAGFVHSSEFPSLPASPDPGMPAVCRSDRERERHRVIDVFRNQPRAKRQAKIPGRK